MAILRKVASRLDSRRVSQQNDRDPRQSGRSSLGLHAQATAAALRQSYRPLSGASTSSAGTVPPTPEQHAQNLPSTPSISAHESRSSSAPTRPSLSVSHSAPAGVGMHRPESRISGESETTGNTDDAQRAARPTSELTAVTPMNKSAPHSHLRKGISEMTQTSRELSPLLRLSSPANSRDMGMSFSRYYNPFADSQASSTTSLPATPRPRNPPLVISTPGTAISNPFESGSSPMSPISPVSPPSTRRRSDRERVFSPFMGDRLIAQGGRYQFPMFEDEPEDDDDMHMPMDDDDIRFRVTWRQLLTKGSICQLLGLVLMISGLLFTFIVMPILYYAGAMGYGYGHSSKSDRVPPPPPDWAWVNDRLYPLLSNVRHGLIDPDTPQSAWMRTGVDGDAMVLVFSDEFNHNNRTFYSGDDPYWFAPDTWYGATQDLEWYDPDAVATTDGVLELRMEQFPNHNLQFRSGMLNSWNQLCFKGGALEVSVSLPGPGGVMGLWPGVWTLGNLARPGYLATSDGTWPYTYDSCDVGITPNQSMTDGTSKLPGQKLASCTCAGEDHPTPGTGRGAPEIDVFEASSDWGGLHNAVVTQSLQVAPFDIWWYPNYNFTAFPDYTISYPNSWTGGPYQQAVSGTTMLNNDWFDGKAYQRYAFEYTPGAGAAGKITWLVGGEVSWIMDGRAIGPNGNVRARQVPQEPMSVVLNLGLSESWAMIDWANLRFPTTMRIDYVRWYQRADAVSVTCDPPGYETTQYIHDHGVAYTNPNLTMWNQTGYDWPRNRLMHGC